MAIDLYAARCGILHTANPVLNPGPKDDPHAIFYQFRGQAGVIMALNAELKSLTLEIEHFAVAFKEGAREFIRTSTNLQRGYRPSKIGRKDSSDGDCAVSVPLAGIGPVGETKGLERT